MSGKSKWKNARGQVLLAVADALELDPHDMVDDSNKRAQTKEELIQRRLCKRPSFVMPENGFDQNGYIDALGNQIIHQ